MVSHDSALPRTTNNGVPPRRELAYIGFDNRSAPMPVAVAARRNDQRGHVPLPIGGRSCPAAFKKSHSACEL